MVVGVGYPLAFTLATALAIWSPRAIEMFDDALDIDISPLLVSAFVVLLGVASFAVGILNPETMVTSALTGSLHLSERGVGP